MNAVSQIPQGLPAVVVGGGSGLGAATGAALAAAGAKVTLIDANAEAVQAQADQIGARAAVCDVTDGDALAALWAEISDDEAPRFVVNCAGVAPAKKIVGRNGAHPLDAFARTIDINLNGSFNVLRVAAEAMTGNVPDEQGSRGCVVLTASVAAYEGQIGQAAYAASKAGVNGMILPAARELAAHGIRVMGIAPGVFETPMVSGFSEEVQQSLYATVPFPHRFGQPREYAHLALSILTNPMLNGTTIRLDGANRLQPS